MPETFVLHWNEQVTRWIELADLGVPGDLRRCGADAILACYEGTDEQELDYEALPEPYVGDPLSEQLQAVLLTLNPGGTLPEHQSYPRGSLVGPMRLRGYHALASDWALAPETRAWWYERTGLPARLTGKPRTVHGIVGIDMLPFHSISYGRLQLDADARDWLVEHVFRPAARIAARTALSRGRRRPVLLAMAAGVRNQLLACGAVPLAVNDLHNGPDRWPTWPRSPEGRPLAYRVDALQLPPRCEINALVVAISVRGRMVGEVPEGLDPVVRDVIDEFA